MHTHNYEVRVAVLLRMKRFEYSKLIKWGRIGAVPYISVNLNKAVKKK